MPYLSVYGAVHRFHPRKNENMAAEEFDGMLMNIAERKRGIEPMLDPRALRGGVCVRVAFQGFIRARFATCKLAGLTTAISCG